MRSSEETNRANICHWPANVPRWSPPDVPIFPPVNTTLSNINLNQARGGIILPDSDFIDDTVEMMDEYQGTVIELLLV